MENKYGQPMDQAAIKKINEMRAPKAIVQKPTFDFEERKALMHLNKALHNLYEAKIQLDILQRDPVIDELMGEEINDIRTDILQAIKKERGERGIQALISYIRQP